MLAIHRTCGRINAVRPSVRTDGVSKLLEVCGVLRIQRPNSSVAQLGSAPAQTACLAFVMLLGLAMIYRNGVRGWFLPLRHPDLRIVLPAGSAGTAEATR